MRILLALGAALLLCTPIALSADKPAAVANETTAMAQKLADSLYKQANAEIERKELQSAREHLEQALLIVCDFRLDKLTEDKVRGALSGLKLQNRAVVTTQRNPFRQFNRVGQSPFQSDDPDEQEFMYLEFIGYAQRHLPANSAQLAKRFSELEKFYRRNGDKDSARAIDKKLVAMLGKARSAQDALSIADECMDAAVGAAQARDVLDAKLLGQPVLTYLDSLEDKTYSRNLGTRLSQLGTAFSGSGDRRDAENYLKAAISLDSGENENRLYADRLLLAKIYEDEGKFSQAAEMREMAVSSEATNAVLSCYVLLSKDYLQLKAPDKAKAAAVKIAEKVALYQTPNDWSLVSQLADLSADFAAQKDVETARLLYTTMFDLAASGNNRAMAHQMICNNFAKLANQLQAVDPKAADELLVTFSSKFLGRPAEESAQAMQTVAQCYIDHQQPDKALDLAEQYLKTCESSGGQQAFNALAQVARFLDGANQQKKAFRLRQEVCEVQEKCGIKDDSRLSNLCELATSAATVGESESARSAISSALKIVDPRLRAAMPATADLVASTINDLSAKQAANAAWLLQTAQRHATYRQGVSKTGLLEEFANYLNQNQDYEQACKFYGAVLRVKAEHSGPSSTEAMAAMIPYAAALRNCGKEAEAESMQEGIDAIQSVLNEQRATGRTLLKPFAPLKETIESVRRGKGLET